MDQPQSLNPAFGMPIAARWTRSDKDGIGTARSSASPLWYTIAKGVVTEVYYPTIDQPQIRDLQYLVTDGETFFHDERRDFDNEHVVLAPGALGYRIDNQSRSAVQGERYRIVKQVISAPTAPCLLVHTKVEASAPLLSKLKLFVLLAPHLDGSGDSNSGWVADSATGKLLVARGRTTWLALGATRPFLQGSCGVVGATDGWQDLKGNAIAGNHPFVLDWQFDSALGSNIALTAQLDLSHGSEFTLGLAFGETLNSAVRRLRAALSIPFSGEPAADGDRYTHLKAFLNGWSSVRAGSEVPGPGVTGDGDDLYRMSCAILLAHEDRINSGALIASLSIPWGETRGDDDLGYHLVWTRDMCNSASALLASGDRETPLSALTFLASVQRDDGSFYQNFRVDGSPHWTGVQLDEIAFPIILAWRLRKEAALQNFDPYPMVRSAVVALILNGPMSQQERWEENEGYSPSTLAASIAAFVCAAAFASERGDATLAGFLADYADFLETHLETWTVANDGQALPGVRHYVRILPTAVKTGPENEHRVGPLGVQARPMSDGKPDRASVQIRNGGPTIAARDHIDPGFLELVRYGIRAADDPAVIDSLRVVDAATTQVKVDFTDPARSGPGWHRYNFDGYGNKSDGSQFDQAPGTRGGTWPLLTGERGHYELAAGRDARPFLHAMERFAIGTGLIPEQLWDLPDLPDKRLRHGYPTGAAMPLAWAHGEYIKLARSITNGKVFDLIPEVATRYLVAHEPSTLEIWNFYRQIDAISPSSTLRIVLGWPFRLRWTDDAWLHAHDTEASRPTRGLYYVDIPPLGRSGAILFTFFWTELQRWQPIDFYRVEVGFPDAVN